MSSAGGKSLFLQRTSFPKRQSVVIKFDRDQARSVQFGMITGVSSEMKGSAVHECSRTNSLSVRRAFSRTISGGRHHGRAVEQQETGGRAPGRVGESKQAINAEQFLAQIFSFQLEMLFRMCETFLSRSPKERGVVAKYAAILECEERVFGEAAKAAILSEGEGVVQLLGGSTVVGLSSLESREAMSNFPFEADLPARRQTVVQPEKMLQNGSGGKQQQHPWGRGQKVNRRMDSLSSFFRESDPAESTCVFPKTYNSQSFLPGAGSSISPPSIPSWCSPLLEEPATTPEEPPANKIAIDSSNVATNQACSVQVLAGGGAGRCSEEGEASASVLSHAASKHSVSDVVEEHARRVAMHVRVVWVVMVLVVVVLSML